MGVKLFLKLLTGTLIAVFIELFFTFNFVSVFGRLNQLFGLLFSIIVVYHFFRAMKLEHSLKRAVFVSVLGLFILWGACTGIVIVLAPGLTNM